MKKTKISPFRKLLQSNKLAAVSVVVLTVSLGSAFLPNIFAATGGKENRIHNLKATPTNDATYKVRLNWDGKTESHWKGRVKLDGVFIEKWTSNNKQRYVDGLRCNRSYLFEVAAVGENGGLKTNWAGVNATTVCPGVSFDQMYANGNTVYVGWRAATGATQGYNLFIKRGNENYRQIATSGTSHSETGPCDTTYSAYIQPHGGGQTGAQSLVRSTKTAACPAAPTGGSGTGSGGGSSGGGSTSSGGSSGGSSTGSSGGSTTRRSSGGGVSTGSSSVVIPKPATPQKLKARIISNKIIELSWLESTNADHYVVTRSVDQKTWQDIANTDETMTSDDDTEFATKYFYRVVAVGANGDKSEPAQLEVTTEAFESSTSNTLTSADKAVSLTIPDGAIDGTYNCTLSAAEDASDAPEGLRTLAGPYDVICVTEEGEIISKFKKAATGTIALAGASEGYSDFTVQANDASGWESISSSYNEQRQQLNFSLTSAKAFAAMGKKQSNPAGAIISVLLLVLLIAAAIVGYLWWRRRTPTMQEVAATQATAEQEFQQALAQPDCGHLAMAQQVVPSSDTCQECQQQHTHYNALRICLVCGHVGCSDDSPEQHAMKHFQETGHPIMYEYGNPNGNTIGWCYVDQTYI